MSPDHRRPQVDEGHTETNEPSVSEIDLAIACADEGWADEHLAEIEGLVDAQAWPSD